MWIIDPLDGTTNFLHGFPQYCVSIALPHKGVVQQGVIYDPVRNDLFTATRGRGAFLNDRRMRVSRRTHLRDCLIGTGFPFRDGSYLDTYLAMMKAMIEQTAGLRRPGAAALDLAYVAAGFYDGFWEVGLNPWDVAAGQPAGAGGRRPDRRPRRAKATTCIGGQVIAANPKIFAQMVTTLGAVPHGMEHERAARAGGDRRPAPDVPTRAVALATGSASGVCSRHDRAMAGLASPLLRSTACPTRVARPGSIAHVIASPPRRLCLRAARARTGRCRALPVRPTPLRQLRVMLHPYAAAPGDSPPRRQAHAARRWPDRR